MITRDSLEKEVCEGESAEIAKSLLDRITNEIIEECKEEFSTIPINNYQNYDNTPIFVLQLKIRVAKEIQDAISRRIADGNSAKKLLKEAMRNV